MDGICRVEVDGKHVTCVGVLIDCVDGEEFPNPENLAAVVSFGKFLVRRAQKALGKWPVHIVADVERSRTADCRRGWRVFAKCVAFNETDPNLIEYGILVWHTEAMSMKLSPPRLDRLNWNTFAEAVDF